MFVNEFEDALRCSRTFPQWSSVLVQSPAVSGVPFGTMIESRYDMARRSLDGVCKVYVISAISPSNVSSPGNDALRTNLKLVGWLMSSLLLWRASGLYQCVRAHMAKTCNIPLHCTLRCRMTEMKSSFDSTVVWTGYGASSGLFSSNLASRAP